MDQCTSNTSPSICHNTVTWWMLFLLFGHSSYLLALLRDKELARVVTSQSQCGIIKALGLLTSIRLLLSKPPFTSLIREKKFVPTSQCFMSIKCNNLWKRFINCKALYKSVIPCRFHPILSRVLGNGQSSIYSRQHGRSTLLVVLSNC